MTMTAARARRLRQLYTDLGYLLKEIDILTEKDKKELEKAVEKEPTEALKTHITAPGATKPLEPEDKELFTEAPFNGQAPIDFSAPVQQEPTLVEETPIQQSLELDPEPEPEPEPPKQSTNRIAIPQVGVIMRKLNASTTHYQEILQLAMSTFQVTTLADVREENVDLFEQHIESAKARFPG